MKEVKIRNVIISNSNWTEWSTIRNGNGTELDDMKSYCQLIIKITISEKRKIAKLFDKGKFYIKKLTKDA